MRFLLHITQQRQLALIEYLVEAKTLLSYEHLASHFNLSERTIQRDVQEIQRLFPKLRFHTEEDRIRLYLPSTQNLATIYRSYLNNLDILPLVLKIFQDETLSDVELAESLYMNTSTLYRRVRSLNQTLEPHDIYIHSNPYYIGGNEEHVRHFYSRVFTELYSPLLWPFSIPEEPFDELLEIGQKYYKSKLSPGTYFSIKLIMLVNYQRFLNGHYMQSDRDTARALMELMQDQDNKHIKATFKKYFNQEYTVEFVEQFCNPLNEIFAILTNQPYSPLLIPDAKFDQDHEYLISFTNDMCQVFDLELENQEELIQALQIAVYHQKIFENFKPVSHNSSLIFMNSVRYLSPIFYEKLKLGLHTYYKMVLPAEEITEEDLTDLMMTFITSWKDLFYQMGQKLQPVKILVVSNHSTHHAAMLRDLFVLYFRNQVDVTIFEDARITLEKLEQAETDIIVANFDIPEIAGKTIITTEDFPSTEDSSTFYQTIHNLRYKHARNDFKINKTEDK